MNCRFCGSPLSQVLIDLGGSPPSNSFLRKEDLDAPETYFPLKVYVCNECFLVQLDEHKKSTEIFSSDYIYFSSTSRIWLEHSRRYVEMIVPRLNLGEDCMVIEIASNDGYLLQYFLERGIPCIGIEPSTGTAEVAKSKGIPVLEEFFSTSLAKGLKANGRLADLVLGNNVLAHVPDINDFVEGMRIILKPRGTITLEFPHLMKLIENDQFDTIYHEHYSYLSLGTVRKIFRSHGLEIYDVEELTTHGGSLRIYARHADFDTLSIFPRVESLIQREEKAGMRSPGYYLNFGERALKIKLDFLAFLLEARRSGKNVAAYGAAAKGNTLLNFCGVKSDLVQFVADAAPSKQGRYLPGSHVPVVSEAFLAQVKPDFVLIFPWNLMQEVCEQLQYIRRWNGKFVTAIPSLRVF